MADPIDAAPERLRLEVQIAEEMFRKLALYDNAGDVTVGAYVVALRGEARDTFFVQDLMNHRAPGKDAIERLAVALILEGADAIVLVSESWMVRSNTKHDIEQWIAEHGSLRDHPDQVERFNVSYHTVSGDWLASALITRADHQPPQLEEWSYQHRQLAEGRFGAFFIKAQMERASDS